MIELMVFFIIGITLSVTPCVLPMVPILSSIIVGSKEQTAFKSFLLSLTYALAMAITYGMAGVLTVYAGSSVSAMFQIPWVLYSFSGLMLIFALSLFGVLEIRLPQIGNYAKGGSFIGVAVMGILSVLIVSPCITPPLAAILLYISETGNMIKGFFQLFFLGLGMGIPLLLGGSMLGKYIPKSGKWNTYIKYGMGFVMLFMAASFGQRAAAIQVDSQAISTVHYAVAQQKVTILQFTAAWCPSCQTMKKVLNSAEVRKELSGFSVITVDLTNDNAANQAKAKRYGVHGIPAFVFLKNGKVVDRIDGATSKAAFIAALKRNK